MQRSIIDLPPILAPLVSDWVLNIRGRSANDGVDGSGQVIIGNQPRWEATLTIMVIRRERVLTWEAIRARMKGRINILRVPICDAFRPRLVDLGLPQVDADQARNPGIPFDDDSLFDDDTGFAMEPGFEIATAIEAGVSEFSFDASGINDALTAGQWFSHDDWPYKVTGTWSEDGLTRVTFEPDLRRPIPEGDWISFHATALMAFTTDLEGRMARRRSKDGEATINLVEWINRP